MNSNIVPQGPQETVTDATVTREAMLIFAETDLIISAVTYKFQANPANAGAVSTFTLKAGRYLAWVSSIAFTGTATVTYVR